MTENATENYTWRDTNVAKEVHGVRTAANVGGFFTPFLRSGMRLLDCGCGPGSITVGLAELVAPGEVIGIDASADLIARAQENAAIAGLSNATFQTGDVYSLPFADDSFDAVWVHALLEHLHDPVAALTEMRRVLKPGGIIGVRELDLDSLLIGPESPALVRFFALFIRLTRENGGDAQIGKKLAALLTAAGFQDVGMSATVEQSGLAARQPFVSAGVFASNMMALLEPFETRGYATAAEIAEMRQALTDWAQSPESILIGLRCDVLAHK
ncbi:MAG: methyltransferase domain-containing protein [Caldilineaceae bacterium]|nr:methyltransferase domain-containing protein [Caldilineaceae bacterium]HRJ43578.1 methyltransferase domain-containing protein [Caldilineaceae bacterium]